MSSTEENPRGRILIADDDPAILRLISTILEKENFSVVHARDGREAYKILQSDANFTAAILDVVMPHISGTELVKFMKSENRLMQIPVMMMTAEQDPKLSSDSFSAGAAMALQVTGSNVDAAKFGNLVASITIMKPGTGVATPTEVLAAATKT